MVAAKSSRLAYIDWMRGLACVLMFQTHCYDSWLSASARQSRFFMYSQLGGTFPAPLFLFLAGISFALATEKLWKKSLRPAQIARITIHRGAEIFAFGLLFRLQEYLIAWGWAPLSDLLRVDILNTIGLSMMLMGVFCWLVLSISRGERARVALVFASAATALLISLLTPLMWTTWRPQCGHAASLALPDLSLECIRLRRIGCRIYLAKPVGAQARGGDFFFGRCRGCRTGGGRSLARCTASPDIRGLRFLAY